jgi:hypothetical protein
MDTNNYPIFKECSVVISNSYYCTCIFWYLFILNTSDRATPHDQHQIS